MSQISNIDHTDQHNIAGWLVGRPIKKGEERKRN
jgi:hypothetical protein